MRKTFSKVGSIQSKQFVKKIVLDKLGISEDPK